MKKSDKVIEISVGELYQRIWEKPIQALAKEFGLSDVGLAKICKRHNIPNPERGYWAKLYAGQKIKKPLLPGPTKGNDIIRIGKVEPVERAPKEEAAPCPIAVPEILKAPHPLIEMAKKSMVFSSTAPCLSMSSRETRCLAIRASKSSFPRALRIMDAIIKAIEKEGFFVRIKEDGKTYLVVNDEEVDVLLRESSKRTQVALDPKRDSFLIRLGETHRFDYTPSGKLHLELGRSSGLRSIWQDTGKRPLESALSDFVESIKQHAEVYRQHRIQRIERERRSFEEVARRHEESRRENELKRQLDNFTYCKAVREYVQSLREGVIAATGQQPQGKAAEWIAWIESHVNKHDAVKNFVERILSSEEA